MPTNRDFTILMQLRADVNQALGGFKQVGDGLDGITSHASRLASTLGVALSVAGLVAWTKKVIDADRAFGDMSTRLGVSVETLSALESVAKKNGAALDDVQNGFRRLAQAAASGTGAAAQALQAMGIPLKQFQQLSASQQFDVVAQKFASYEDGSKKAALAVALLGRSGLNLIPVLNQVGTQGLDAVTQRAKEAGVAVGQDAVDAANAFGVAAQTLGEKLRGATNEGLAKFTPDVERLTQLLNDPEFQKSLNTVAEGIARIGRAAIDATAGLVTFTSQVGTGLGIVAGQLATGITDPNDAGGSVAQQINQVTQALKNLQATRDGLAAGASPRALGVDVKDVADADKQIASLQTRLDLLRKAQTDIQRNGGSVGVTHARPATATASASRTLTKTQAPLLPDAAETARRNAAALAAQREAARIAKDAAQAQAALTQSIIDMQGQLDPVAKAWSDYNAVVSKATDEAERAKQARGADNAAIDAQREAAVKLAATLRDQALDQIAQKDRDAWEQLKRSLATPAEVDVANAMDKIKELNDLLARGAITAQQYADATAKAVHQTVAGSGPPQFQGLSPEVGGPFSDFLRVQDAASQEDAYYKGQLDRLAAFQDERGQLSEAANAELEAATQAHNQRVAAIDNARNTAMVTGMSAAFDQAAETVRSSFGEQSAAYRVAFGLAKGAAIAQSTVAMFQAIAEASKMPWPSNIPLIAQAMAQGLSIIASIRAVAAPASSGYAAGGYIRGPGSGTSDSIPARLSNGEYVVRAAAVQKYGVAYLEALNARRFADGGLVAPSPADMGMAPGIVPAPSVSVNAPAGASPDVNISNMLLFDKDQLAEAMLNSPKGRKLIVSVVGEHPQAIQASWRS